MSDFWDVVFGRRSVRKYVDTQIDFDIIKELITGAIYAPSASNIQPWVFGIISNKELIRKVEAFSPGMPRGANVIVAVCSDQKLSKEKGGNPNLSTLDCAMAGQNLQLAAHAKNVGSCVLCSFNRQAVSALLRLPEYVYIEYLISLGYYTGELKAPKRKPVEEVIFHNLWSNLE